MCSFGLFVVTATNIDCFFAHNAESSPVIGVGKTVMTLLPIRVT